MSRADESHSTLAPEAEYRRLVYRMFRMQGIRRGRPYRLPAREAWRLARLYPLPIAEQYAGAMR